MPNGEHQAITSNGLAPIYRHIKEKEPSLRGPEILDAPAAGPRPDRQPWSLRWSQSVRLFARR
jgi:hypothetical protein